MSVIKFPYLQRKRTLTLIIILTLASTLFSVTAYSFLGFYNGFTSYVGEQKDIIALYSKSSSTPYTGVIPLSVADMVEPQTGVIAISPEIIAPCTINNQSIFIRGIIPSAVAELNSPIIQEGQYLNLTDTNACIIGSNLANRLRLKTGDSFLAFAVIAKNYVELEVKGIFTTQTALDDEALVPLYTGQWLRGISYNHATLIRIKIDPNQTSANQIYQQITNQTTPTNPTPSSTPNPTEKSQTKQQLETLIPLIRTNINIGTIDAAESKEFMQSYLNRYGISKDTLIVLSIAVFIFASGTAASAITLFIKQHSSELDTIKSIGASNRKIKFDLTLRMITWALIATFVGTLISAAFIVAFQKLGYLQVLSHTITFQLDPLIVIANFCLLGVLIGFNILKMELKQ
jgi:ABC-type lipoprotein release transport system permease subunit